MTSPPPAPLPQPIRAGEYGSKPDGRGARAQRRRATAPNRFAPPIVMLPAGLMPPYHETPPDGPRWQWVMDARAAATEQDTPEPEPVFSTFPGEPPDVWPSCTRETPPASSGGLLVVVASAVLAMLFGMMLARWHLRRLRMR